MDGETVRVSDVHAVDDIDAVDEIERDALPLEHNDIADDFVPDKVAEREYVVVGLPVATDDGETVNETVSVRVCVEPKEGDAEIVALRVPPDDDADSDVVANSESVIALVAENVAIEAVNEGEVVIEPEL